MGQWSWHLWSVLQLKAFVWVTTTSDVIWSDDNKWWWMTCVTRNTGSRNRPVWRYVLFGWFIVLQYLPNLEFTPWNLLFYSQIYDDASIRSNTTLNYWMMVESYPTLKEEVNGSILDCEISSLLLVRWSIASCALAMVCQPSLSNIYIWRSTNHNEVGNRFFHCLLLVMAQSMSCLLIP